MSATLSVSVVHPGTPVEAECGVILRVRPARGRPVERCLSLRATEQLVLDPGEVTVDAVLSSGQTQTWNLSLSEGETETIEISIPASPHEAMRWLNLSREPMEPVTPRSVPERLRGFDAEDAWSGLSALEGTRPGRETLSVEIVARRLPGAKVVSDLAYSEGRILHVLDDRDVDIFGEVGDTALALLKLRQPALPDTWRVCALPGPWFYSRSDREIHVALRDIEGDALPDVQIVPANEDLATVVGYLERRDQRALSVLREKFVGRAVQYMRDKKRDPLAAAVGLAMLLRLGDLDQVGGWSQNLWKWFPALPDGGALHAAVMLRDPKDTKAWRDEFRAATLGSAKTGLPLLSDSLRYLRQASGLLQDFDDSAEPAAARTWSDRLVRSLDADAVFSTVTLHTKQLDWIWGAPKNPGGTP